MLTAVIGTYPRLEIGTLTQDDYQFSLFAQAMTNLQAEKYEPVAASWQEMGMCLLQHWINRF